MSDVKYTSRSFDAFPSQQVPTSPPPPPPEHRYFTSSPPSLNSPSTSDSYDTENPASTNTTPDSRSTSVFTQQQPNDHHHGNAPTADETASGVNSSPNLPRAFSLSSLIRDEEQPEDPEHPQVISISTSNPSHLFWVPATQHPELAPNEFEKFLHTNSHAKRERASLRRRSSILSVSFTASDALKQDDDEGMTEGDSRKDTLEALERGKSQQSSEYSEQYHQQKQHNSSRSGDAEGLPRKTRLRRSISLDMATAAENQLRVPDFLVFDRNSSPLDQSRVLVPRADRPSLLRRGARTKFQRNSSFTPPSARQVDRHRQTESMPPGTYTERLDHSTLGEGGITLSDSPLAEPPLNMSLSIAEPSPPPLPQSTSAHAMFSPRPMERRASAEEVPRLQNSSTPSKDHEVQGLEIGQNVVTQELEPLEHQSHEQQQQQQQHQLDPPARASSERKSSWSWGFKRSKSEQVRSDVISDKVHLQAELMPRPRPSVSSESSGSAATPSGSGNGVAPLAPNSNSSGGKDSSGKRSFGLSSLFSRKSSSNKAQATAEPAAQNTAPIPPKDFQLNRINQNRLPIHIERAIYRLSHSKLANPRRPLHQQVIISNLMFAYLALVSASQQAHQQNSSNGATPDNRARKFVNAGKKGKRRPPSNSSSPRPPSSQQQQQQQQHHQHHQHQQQHSQLHTQQQQQSQHGRPPSPSNGSADQRSSYQQKARSNSKQEDNGNGVLHQFMGPSTGFVVPENYLKPRQQGFKGMAGVGRRSSLSDSDEDDDDDALSDSSSDDEPSNSSVTMKARAAAATKHRASNDMIPNHTRVAKQRGDDDVPLAMYRKGKV